MNDPKPLLARITALVGAGNAELRDLWISTFPEDATADEKANRAKNDAIRAEEAKKAAAAAAAAAAPTPSTPAP